MNSDPRHRLDRPARKPNRLRQPPDGHAAVSPKLGILLAALSVVVVGPLAGTLAVGDPLVGAALGFGAALLYAGWHAGIDGRQCVDARDGSDGWLAADCAFRCCPAGD